MSRKKLFVSYRRTSWSFTYWLIEELAKLLDTDIFVDYSGIDETNFENALLNNLRDSDAVLLIVSDDTFSNRIHHDKDWVRREIREALALGIPMALACHNGLLPHADLPDDIQAIRKVQGIEFYPRFFKAGVHELAAFIDRSTPINLQALTSLESPQPNTSQSPKAMLDNATSLHESGQYDQALMIYDKLISEGYQPRLLSLRELRDKAIVDRDTEQRRWEAGEIYDEIASLFRIEPIRAIDEYRKFRTQYPDFYEDPAELGQKEKLLIKKESASSVEPPNTSTRLKQKVSGIAQKNIAPPHSPKKTLSTKLVAILKGHTKQVNAVAFSPLGNVIASGSGGDFGFGDTSVRLWYGIEQNEHSIIKKYNHTIGDVVFSPDGNYLASANYDGMVYLWSISKQKQVVSLRGHTNWVMSVAFSPDGTLLASAGYDKTICIWSVDEQKQVGSLKGHSFWVNSVAFSPDGRLLASASDDKTVNLWSVREQKQIDSPRGHTDNINSVAFSPDGTLLASASDDKTVSLWSVREQKQLASLVVHTGPVNSVAFSPDGRLLASASDDKTVGLWNVKKQQYLTSLLGHTAEVNSVAFSPVDKLIVSGSHDQTIILWEYT